MSLFCRSDNTAVNGYDMRCEYGTHLGSHNDGYEGSWPRGPYCPSKCFKCFKYILDVLFPFYFTLTRPCSFTFYPIFFQVALLCVAFKPRYRKNRAEEMTRLLIVSGFNVAENRWKLILLLNKQYQCEGLPEQAEH